MRSAVPVGRNEEGSPLKVRPQAIFSFVFLIFFIVFAYMAKDWRLQAKLYPWVIGIPMVILALVQLILDLKGIERKQQDAAPVDSLTLTAIAWVFFHVLFVRLLTLPFPEGMIFTWLGWS
jgi:hypothetical protein